MSSGQPGQYIETMSKTKSKRLEIDILHESVFAWHAQAPWLICLVLEKEKPWETQRM